MAHKDVVWRGRNYPIAINVPPPSSNRPPRASMRQRARLARALKSSRLPKCFALLQLCSLQMAADAHVALVEFISRQNGVGTAAGGLRYARWQSRPELCGSWAPERGQTCLWASVNVDPLRASMLLAPQYVASKLSREDGRRSELPQQCVPWHHTIPCLAPHPACVEVPCCQADRQFRLTRPVSMWHGTAIRPSGGRRPVLQIALQYLHRFSIFVRGTAVA